MTVCDISRYDTVETVRTVHIVSVNGVETVFDDYDEAASYLTAAFADLEHGTVTSLSIEVREEHCSLLQQLVETYEAQSHPGDSCGWLVSEDDQYLLVERNVVHGGLWLTTFGDPADASDYHENQEYAEEWSVVELVDLHSGSVFEAATSIEWR